MDLNYESFDNEYEIAKLCCLKSRIKLSDSKDKECVVCGDIQNNWEMYQLPCMHYGHTRCIRKWLSIKKKPECPWCRENTPKLKYCNTCVKWGDHGDFEGDECPLIQNIFMNCK